MDSSGQPQVTNGHLGMAGINSVSGISWLVLLVHGVRVYSADAGILPLIHATVSLKFQSTPPGGAI